MKLQEARILVVDDEPQLCEIFMRWLTAAGCANVLSAPDGEAALTILAAHRIDMLVTDIRMPRIDGVSLVRTLMNMGKPGPTIIFVSGFGEIEPREMYGLGVEAFLNKPLRREDLLKAVTASLAERSELWLEPMGMAPTQSMNMEAESCDFHLGRGGFSAPFHEPLNLGKVAFHCLVPLEHREIGGEGYVRWFSQGDQLAGVEFYFLDSACRDWVLGEIASTKPQSFIPA